MTEQPPVSMPFGRLSEVVAHGPEDREPVPGFLASLRGKNVEVTAVLERTAVVAPIGDRWADKQVVRLADLQVDPEAITWRPKPFSAGFRRRRYTSEQRQALRGASDRRARADQARQAAAQAAARQTAAPQRAARIARTSVGATTSRPVAAAAAPRAITAAVVTTPTSTTTSEQQQPAAILAAELQRARRRIAELEAELERHRAVERDVVRRVDLVVRRRAA